MADPVMSQPGREHLMEPRPRFRARERRGSGRLDGRRALVTGGDSGIGRAVAVAFAREGADVAISYLCEDRDAEETRRLVEAEGRRAELLPGDLGDRRVAAEVVERTVDALGGLDVLVNNAAEQHVEEHFEEIDLDDVERTFRTNVLAMLAVTKFALPHLRPGDAIVNTSSVTAYKGQPVLVDYSATKGAIIGFTRALSQQLAERGIRVNAVAPGPIWTPLIPATFGPEHVEEFGRNTALGRPGQPAEVAECYVFLASDDASYMTGQVLHPNGGSVVGG
jgi:NAD(P)-dependent dehydrogenase (short-subunit alcohol dehydrogenase family)